VISVACSCLELFLLRVRGRSELANPCSVVIVLFLDSLFSNEVLSSVGL
jgi:hypothetical protein